MSETPPPSLGQWVWVHDPADAEGGRWYWYAAGPAPQDHGFDPGRFGQFLGAYLALGLVFSLYGFLLAALVGNETGDGPVGLDPAGRIVAGVLAIGFAAGLFVLGHRTRTGSTQPLAVMSAFGSNMFVPLGVFMLATGTGLSGDAAFWVSALIVTPLLIATLMAIPHPLLGLSVAIAVITVTSRVPLLGESVVVRALVAGAVLTYAVLAIEAKTKARSGALLYYAALLAFLVAKIGLQFQDHRTSVTLAALFPFALIELMGSVVSQRRSWSVSAWITLAFALQGVARLVFIEPLGLSTDVSGLVGLVLIIGAIVVSMQRQTITDRLINALPPNLRPGFLALAPSAPPSRSGAPALPGLTLAAPPMAPPAAPPAPR